jgi:hypothetical protein
MITVKLLDTVSQIEDKVNQAIAEKANEILIQNKTNILQKCRSLISGWVSSQPEMQSLQSNVPGSLAGQFGLYPGQSISTVGTIIRAVENSITIDLKKFNRKLSGGLEVNFQPSSFINLLSLPQGFVNYENGSLHWIQWLLLKGDTVIVVNYQYNPSSGIGRSGLGNMVSGGFFRVPPQFSGTDKDNFITRALIGPSQEEAIVKIFKDVLGA